MSGAVLEKNGSQELVWGGSRLQQDPRFFLKTGQRLLFSSRLWPYLLPTCLEVEGKNVVCYASVITDFSRVSGNTDSCRAVFVRLAGHYAVEAVDYSPNYSSDVGFVRCIIQFKKLALLNDETNAPIEYLLSIIRDENIHPARRCGVECHIG